MFLENKKIGVADYKSAIDPLAGAEKTRNVVFDLKTKSVPPDTKTYPEPTSRCADPGLAGSICPPVRR